MALTNNRKTPQLGREPVVPFVPVPVAAGAHIYAGAAFGINAGGYAVPGGTAGITRMIGVAENEADNTGGANGAITVNGRRGAFPFACGTAGDALTIADLYATVYALDDQTAARTNNAGARPALGRLVFVDGTDFYVEVGLS